jgi:hypothetical protein
LREKNVKKKEKGLIFFSFVDRVLAVPPPIKKKRIDKKQSVHLLAFSPASFQGPPQLLKMEDQTLVVLRKNQRKKIKSNPSYTF